MTKKLQSDSSYALDFKLFQEDLMKAEDLKNRDFYFDSSFLTEEKLKMMIISLSAPSIDKDSSDLESLGEMLGNLDEYIKVLFPEPFECNLGNYESISSPHERRIF